MDESRWEGFTRRFPRKLLAVGLSRAGDLEGAYAQWSLSRLREQAVKGGIVESIGEEWLRVIYRIWDGASNHWTPEIRSWAKANNVRLVSTPTHASHLNPVECHAGDLQKLALAGEEFTTPREVGRALDRAVTDRNHERKRRGKRFRQPTAALLISPEPVHRLR